MKIITRRPRTFRRLWLTLTPVAALLLPGGPVIAREGNVFGLTLAQSLQYDTNLFRVAPETDNRRTLGSDRRDDFISSTTLGLDLNKQIGRHTFYADISHSFVTFQEYDRLDYTAENDRVGWSGVFGADNSWDTSFKHVVNQSDFADLQVAFGNVVTTDTLTGSVSSRIGKDWVLRPTLFRETYFNSAAIKQTNDGSARGGWLYFGYRPYTDNVLEAQYRYLERDYDIGGGYRQSEPGIFGNWAIGTTSGLEGRIALVQQTIRSGSAPGIGDFHQTVGHVAYRWRASGHSMFNLRLFRELSTISLGTDQDAVARGVTAQWAWTPLAKVKFDTIFDYRKREFPNANAIDPAEPTTRIGVKDRTHSILLGATYVPAPSWTIQANAKEEVRHAEPSYRGYKDRLYTLSLQYSF